MEEGIMGETKSFLILISKTAHLYLCQLFLGGACSLKQSLAQYFFMKLCVCYNCSLHNMCYFSSVAYEYRSYLKQVLWIFKVKLYNQILKLYK